MNKFKQFLIVMMSSALVITFVLGLILHKVGNEDVPMNDVLLFDDYYFYKSDWMHSRIYAKDRYSEEKGYKSDITVFKGWIYKYSYDKENGFIAVRIFDYIDDDSSKNAFLYKRWFGHNEYKIIEDSLILR